MPAGERISQPLSAPALLSCGWVIGLLALVVVGLLGVWPSPPAKDFSFFYAAGQYWQAHGQPAPSGRLGHLAWYQPFAIRCLALLAYLPARWAGAIWVVGNAGCLWASAWLIGRYWHGHGWRFELPAMLALTLYAYVQFDLNQTTPPVLLLVVVGFVALQSRRDALAGVSIGVATLLKITPALLLLWLLLKRRWRAVGCCVAVVLLLGPGIDALDAGWQQAWQWQIDWIQRIRYSGSAWVILQSGQQADVGNHSVAAIVHRWVDGGHGLIRTACWGALTLGGLAVLVVASLRSSRKDDPPRWRWEFALWCLGMLWLSPVVRQYHLLFTYPAISLLLNEARFGLCRRTPCLVLGVWVLLMLVGWPMAVQRYPVTLVGLSALAAGSLVCMRRSVCSTRPGQ
jgi:alpha-1,2-mannosyltransferase